MGDRVSVPGRRPRLPMLLGLAVLTTAAHVLVAGAHLIGGHADWRDWPLLTLLALAPIAGVWLAMRGRPRHGAVVFAMTMAAAATWTLYSHRPLGGDIADPALYAWIVQLMLAFELQGAALGIMLSLHPQAPPASDTAPA